MTAAESPTRDPAIHWLERLAPFALLVLHALAYCRWTEDDAGISLRYADNLVRGVGLVYNPDARIEAISNLGYTLLLALARATMSAEQARFGLLVAAKLLGLSAGLLSLASARGLAHTIGLAPRAANNALVLIAASTPFAAWCVGGLETPFVAWAATALIGSAARLASPARGPTSDTSLATACVPVAALILLRVDGFVLPLMLALLFFVVIPDRTRSGFAILATTFAAFLSVSGFRYIYYGHWLPASVAAKVDLATTFDRLYGVGFDYVVGFGSLYGHVTIVIALCVAAVVLSPRELRRPLLVVAGGGSALVAYAMVIGGDWMPLYRFLVPPLPAVAVLMVMTVARASDRFQIGPVTRQTLVVAVAAVIVTLGHRSFRTRRDSPLWYLHPTFSAAALHEFWTPATDWLTVNVAAGETLLTSEAGFIPYLSGLRTIDSYGLATPAISDLPVDSVRRGSLGVLTEFVAAEPADAAQRWLSECGASVLILQDRMIANWNGGETPSTLFGGRWQRTPDSPIGRWGVYVPTFRE